MKIIPIYRAEASLLKVSSLPDGLVDSAIAKYSFAFYNERNCDKCELQEQRHSEPCDNCEHYLGTRQLAKVVKKGSNKYLSVPLGGIKKLSNLLSAYDLKPRLVDKYGVPEDFRRPIKLIREPREWQTEALEVALERKRGMIVAPPRSGKTVFGVMLAAAVGKKTLIIASQRDWLTQFRYTFVGTTGEDPFTNINPKRIGFCKTLEDFEKNDVCLCTFQQFMNASGSELLKKISRMFALVLIDECHGTAALATSRVLSKFSCEYMIGLTGTPSRKRADEEVIFKLIIGPVLFKAKVERLVPTVDLIETGTALQLPKAASKAGFSRWVTGLEADKKRVKIIAKYAANAIKKGHSVMLPLARTKSVAKYIDAINDHFEEVVAVSFLGGMKPQMRDQRLADIKSGEYRAVVGNIALLSTGLNIPRLSLLIDRVTPTSNLPKVKQRWARVLTPMPGKKPPMVAIVMDNIDAQRAMAKNEYWNAIKPEFSPIISKEHQRRLSEWFNKKDAAPIRTQQGRVTL